MSKSQHKAEFVKTLVPGERAWFLNVAGITMEAPRKKLVSAMTGKVLRSDRKPWEIFRLNLVPEDDNEHDPFAVRVDVYIKGRDGKWSPRPLGYLRKTFKKRGVFNNKAIRSFMQNQSIHIRGKKFSGKEGKDLIDVRLVHISWDENEEIPEVYVAVITDEWHTALPRGCSKIESVGVPANESQMPPKIKPEPKPKPEPADPGKHAGEMPVVELNDYPTIEQVDYMIKLHREFESLFRLVERYRDPQTQEMNKYYCVPVFMSQWHGDPIRFESYRAISNYQAEQMEPVYGDLSTCVDLKEMEKDYGPVMAQAYYRFNGIYEGPVTRFHVKQITENLEQALRHFKSFRTAPVTHSG